MRPVPVVRRRLAFMLQLTARTRKDENKAGARLENIQRRIFFLGYAHDEQRLC